MNGFISHFNFGSDVKPIKASSSNNDIITKKDLELAKKDYEIDKLRAENVRLKAYLNDPKLTSITETARVLGVGRNTLFKKLKELSWTVHSPGCRIGHNAAHTFAYKNEYAISFLVPTGDKKQPLMKSKTFITPKGRAELRLIFSAKGLING